MNDEQYTTTELLIAWKIIQACFRDAMIAADKNDG